MINRVILFVMLLLGVVSAQKLAILEITAEKSADIAPTELMFYTDKMRSASFEILKAQKTFQIQTRESLQSQVRDLLNSGITLDPDFGENLPKTGSILKMDYIAQMRINKMGSAYTLTGELHQVENGELLGNFSQKVNSIKEMEKVIEKQSSILLNRLLQARVESLAEDQLGIIGVKTSNEDFDDGFVTLEITSEPSGATINIDGRPLPSCVATPCKARVAKGGHLIYAVLDAHADLEQKILVNADNQKVNLKLSPNFGTLVLNPSIPVAWNPAFLEMRIADQVVDIGAYRLAPGKHKVKISHPCAQNTSFQVGLKKGGMEVFDRKLSPRMAELTMKAEHKGKKNRVPLWVDGKKVGQTPWTGRVPVCAEVEVGAAKAKLDVNLSSSEPNVIVYEQP
ncbi:MAG: PEGA domain-containing protein [Fibrobacter sp.]|nr:PEGA domain-containing protein [Fibrobacter sp.]